MSPILMVHIAAGTAAVLAGATALSTRKGETAHRTAGFVFVPAMIVMGVTAAFLQPDVGNFTAAGLTTYWVLTAWMTVKRKEKETGLFELGAGLLALLFAAGGYWSAWLVISGAKAADNPFIAAATIFLSSAVALAGLADLSVVLRKGLSGRQRIARHLWRMCLALVIALGSFAAQGMDALPTYLQGPITVFGPMILLLAIMIYWLVRVLLTREFAAPQHEPLTSD